MNLIILQKLQKARQLIVSNDYARGLAIYAELFKQSPQCGGEYGRAAAHSGDFELVVHIWEKIRKQEPNNVSYLVWLAGEYAKIGLHSRSRLLLAKAVKVEPQNLDARIKHAWVLSRTNSVEEAREAVAVCLKLDPGNQIGRYLSACLDRRENKLEAAESRLRDLLTTGVQKDNVRYACRCELAQILDRTERFAEAMAQLELAKFEARRTNSPQPEHEHLLGREKEIHQARALPRNILQTWTQSFPPDKRSPTQPLIFLTGSARSGTTLLEKVLDAHPSIAAFDESFAFERIKLMVNPTASISPSFLNLWRQRYVNNLLADMATAGRDQILVDKNPSHTYWLPAFLRVFPELRVVIGLRDPRDIMVSLYFQDHPNTNRLTFAQLAQHYGEVMDFWLVVREWEGLNWMETRYEDIVADLQIEGSKVTRFLGLAWHENQGRFYEKNREKPILSNNFHDVTKPVYTRSVGRWRAYEKYLAPILPALVPYCKKFGYE